jgi:hypothetical protein
LLVLVLISCFVFFVEERFSRMRRFSNPPILPARLLSTTTTLYAWKPWNNDFSMEVQTATTLPVAPIPFNVAPLLKYTRDNRAMFIQGSPSCGKSSLSHAIERCAVSADGNGYAEVCVPNTKGTDGQLVDDKVKALTKARTKKTCLFIVDEAQDQIARNVIDPSGMYKDGFHVMYFGTTTRTTADFKTPAELASHRRWMYAPAVDRQQVRDFAERVLQHHGADPKEASRLAEQAFDYVGASMGMLIMLLQAIVEGQGTFPTPNALLTNYQPRVVVNGDSVWEYYPRKIALAKEILAVGKATVTSKSDDEAKGWLRRGFVCPFRDFDSDEAIVPWKSDSVDVGWANSWQVTFCRIRERAIQPLTTESVSQAKLKVPVDALLRFLPAFDIETLVPNVVGGVTSLNASEYNFQSQFDRAIKRAFPQASVQNEAQTKGTTGKRGRLDFIVQPTPGDRTSVWWGYELVVRGTGEALDEHKSRFATKGKYNNLDWDDYLLLDCHTEPVRKTDVNKSVKVATISPHQTEGWNVIVLDHRGKRVNIPRDGVPRYVADWGNPVVKVAVKLFDPAHNVVLHLGKGRPNKTIRVPHRVDEKRAVGDIKMWLLMNVARLRGTKGTQLHFFAPGSKNELDEVDPVVVPMKAPKTVHYHVFIK